MSSLHTLLPLAATLAAGLFCAAPASAHIDMRWPPPRTPGAPDNTLSRGPCGQRSNGRLADKVTVLSPGQTIDVVWDVYVQHVSYFRVAFDADGDDSLSSRAALPADPATDDPTLLPVGEGETILAYVEDRTGDIDHVEQRVTLPNVTCDNCTLQVTMFTYGLPLASATYYQCADIVLSGPLLSSGDAASDADAGALLDPGGLAAPSVQSESAPETSSCAFSPGRAAPGRGWLAVGVVLAFAAALRRSRQARGSALGK